MEGGCLLARMASAGGDQTGVLELQKQDLESFTNNFSGDNFICQVQYSHLYHGKIPEGWKGLKGGDVTVKMYLIHEEPRYLIRDLSAAHILLDKDWNLVLISYFMLDAKPMDITEPDAHLDRVNFGSWGYIDYAYCGTGLSREYSDHQMYLLLASYSVSFSSNVRLRNILSLDGVSYIAMLMNSIPWTLCWEYHSLTRV
ncbi:OLC1v1019498C1 [Oldenlandia corymbosa var. corymbosa]|uniref:OLC1v1019498C1 n=1 Tax=Oldenlandia corymbosa var. corymbosa TaxID=529605 RepID=A0AAV1EEA4_OLDCO|nr:OLC1v1019498C1 [Oldenlandia corymbosa var. corymbosa]